MSDKITSYDNSEDNDDSSSEENQAIFDQRFNDLTNDFGRACEKNGVETAIAIAIHPEEQHPIIFVRGHKYDIATLLATILRNLKSEIISELDSNPQMDYSE